MKKTILASLLVSVAVLPGCGAESKAPQFLVSNLSISKSDGSSYSTTFKGSATVSSSAPELKGKTVVVALKAKNKTGKATEDFEQWVVVSDGVGKIEIFDYVSEENAQAPTYSNWEAVGYWELSPATVKYK